MAISDYALEGKERAFTLLFPLPHGGKVTVRVAAGESLEDGRTSAEGGGGTNPDQPPQEPCLPFRVCYSV